MDPKKLRALLIQNLRQAEEKFAAAEGAFISAKAEIVGLDWLMEEARQRQQDTPGLGLQAALKLVALQERELLCRKLNLAQDESLEEIEEALAAYVRQQVHQEAICHAQARSASAN